MRRTSRWMLLAVTIIGLMLSACSQKAQAPTKVQPVHVESIEGSDLSRVVVTERARQRLDVQTAQVREERFARKRSFGGEVVDTQDSALVRVPLNASDLEKVDRSQPVTVRPLENSGASWTAQCATAPDPQEASRALYVMIPGSGTALLPKERVFAEVYMLGNGGLQTIVPYAAVLYDTDGETWAYTSPEPLVYVRHPITVDYIEGDLAVLSEGPPVGTEIVTAGAAELFGAESGIGGGGH